MQLKIQDELLNVFIKGTYLPKDKNAVAVVGSRKISTRGQKLAYDFAFYLAKNKFTIVSGLALGVDTLAHSAALDADGRTIAVLAHGLDRVYPQENKKLAEKIIKHGCLLTKFKECTTPVGKNFLARNQIIAGLSRAVVVIEGEKRSGSISTANHAANLGVEVFAIPGSPATDWLIENGANIANKPEDVLDYLNGRY
ncbi:MAG TPA: DNA-processing protein DprA [Patescibacteria group bacterium]|nr:DNA-processing protein DprA [Patescibacteria group bacterium]